MNTDNLKNETPADAKPVLSAVKIGRKEYPVKKGDYILYNGACYQFLFRRW